MRKTERDRFIPPIKKVKLCAPFPPCPSPFMQRMRPLLRFLRVFREGAYPVVIREMDVETYFQYFGVMLDIAEELAQLGKDDITNTIDLVRRWCVEAKENADKKPELYTIATGIKDQTFFRALTFSERAKLDAAIDEVNPVLADAKKKLNSLVDAVMQDLQKKILDVTPGEASLISSVPDIQEKPSTA